MVAIDGPVGAGKSTVAPAPRASCSASTTSIPARCTARSRWRRATPASATTIPRPSASSARCSRSTRIEFSAGRIMLDGRDVSAELGTPAISEIASRLSTLGVVRARMRELQRAAGERGGVVMEGRDIGTAVFPDAEFKFFLDASAEVRAERRWRELAARGVKIARRGSARAIARTRPARSRSRACAAQVRARRDCGRLEPDGCRRGRNAMAAARQGQRRRS